MGIIKGIKEIIRKVKVHNIRSNGYSLPYVNQVKQYGDDEEDSFYKLLKRKLPKAIIYRNICLDETSAKGEIDFLIIYNLNAFIVELKSWKGIIYQSDDRFYQSKVSYDSTFNKEVPSPFKQIKTNTYLLKKKFPHIWFYNAIIFNEADKLLLKEDIPYFIEVNDLINYIKNQEIRNTQKSIEYLIDNIVVYDFIYSNSFLNEKGKKCIIKDLSITFDINNIHISKKDIISIKIDHHYSYDTLFIETKYYGLLKTDIENKAIVYIDNNETHLVSLSKIDYIKVN